MSGDKRQRWATWLTLAAVVAVALVGVGVALERYNRKARLTEFTKRFQLLATLRRDALQNYFDTVRTEITFWSVNDTMVDRHQEFVSHWQRLAHSKGDPGEVLRGLYVEDNPLPPSQHRELTDAGDGSDYSQLHRRLHPLVSLFVLERGYYDLFLIDRGGNVLYTVEKENDFGTNLLDGRWKDTGLAEVYRLAIEDAEQDKQDAVAFSDLATYTPSGDAAAMFAARAMKDEQGEVVGVLALQLPTNRIQEIMQFKAGMGETGETYLVGDDLLMRSDSRFASDSTILRTRVDTESVRRAFQGESGVILTEDYRGVRVLSAFSRAQIDELQWAVLAEVDEDEVLRSVSRERSKLSGALALVYALILSSVWFVGTGDWSGAGGGLAPFDPDLIDLSD